MPWKTENRYGEVLWNGEDRIVVIPKDFVLVGDKVVIRQDKDGVITIHPATEEGRLALDSFSPFGDWIDEDWRRFAEHDWSDHPLFGRETARPPRPEAQRKNRS